MMTLLTNKRHFAVSLLLSLLLLTTIGFGQSAAPATGTHSVLVQTDVRAKMRDGVTLVTDIYRPKDEGKFPVLLTRTPYNRKDAATGHFLASHGYVVLLQDTRGRFDSEGEFYPFKHEMNDGYDTIEWAASLPYADGRVGMFGGSYVGATQMLAAASNPPHLVGIFPYVTASEYYEGWTYEGGALDAMVRQFVDLGVGRRHLAAEDARGSTRSKEWVEKLPVEDYRLLSLPDGRRRRALFPRLGRARDATMSSGAAIKVSDHYGKMNIKALHAGGWHDIFSGGSIRNFIDLRKQAPTPDARDGQRLLDGAVGARGDFARRQDWRRDLRHTSRAGYERHDPEVVRLRDEGQAERIRDRRARQDLCDGRQRLAR